MSDSINADQIAYWDNDAGRRWVSRQDRIDAMLAPLTETLLDHADPRLGEQVLDIGCGFGTTALALSRRVGVGGSVLGVDVSRPMLDLAERRVAAEGVANIELCLADASTHAFAHATIDLAFSRFGVMFFADPTAAFANIRSAMRKNARLVFVCWRRMADNPCFLVPYLAAKPHLPPQPQPDPEAPGMFAFADSDRLRRLLTGAGFSELEIAPHDPVMRLGDLEQAVEYALRMGPVTRALATATPEQTQAVEAAIRDALTRLDKPDGVELAGGVWIVSARA